MARPLLGSITVVLASSALAITTPAGADPTATASAPDRVGQFSTITGAARIKPERKLHAVLSCATTCDIAVTAKLLRPRGDLGFGRPVRFNNLSPKRYGHVTYTIGRGATDRLKQETRQSKLQVRATVEDPATGRVDRLRRIIHFKNPPRPRPDRGGGGGGCEPGYSPCLPITGDLDCDDIPESQKPVIVTGGDRYNLDADGDGVGCES